MDQRTKIVHTSDIHAGYNPTIKRDTQGLSVLNWDLVYFLVKLITYLIARGDILLIIDDGDFFDAKGVNATIQRYIHKNIIMPLRKAKIGILFVTGNHDSYSDNEQKASDIDFFDHYLEQNCIVVNEWSALNPELSSGNFLWLNGMQENKINAWWQKFILPNLAEAKIGLCLFPYKDEAYIKDVYYRNNNPEVSNEDWGKIKRTLTSEKLQLFTKERIISLMHNHLKGMRMLAEMHFRLDGSKLNQYMSEETYTNEFKFNKEMLTGFSKVIAGHIHLPQKMWGDENIFHIGSLTYTDFGEINDEKRYGIYDILTDKMEFKSVVFGKALPNEPALRKVGSITITVPENTPDPTAFVKTALEKRSAEISEALIKIYIVISPADDLRLSLDVVMATADKLTFFNRIEITHTESEILAEGEKQEVIENINLTAMFDQYIQKYASNPQFDLIKRFAKEALDQALAMNINDEE